MTNIGYLVHDCADAAVARRVAMFDAGGARTTLAGFLRHGRTVPDLPGLDAPPRVLGRSEDGRLAARAISVLRAGTLGLEGLARAFAGTDVLVARNLEMLALAVRLRRQLVSRHGTRPRLVYECLDIHRLLTGRGAPARAIQALERRLAPEVDLVVTSSPAFVRHHLGKVFDAPVRLEENRVAAFGPEVPDRAPPRPPGPPWRIGWFGMLRCRRSFELLSALAKARNGEVEVLLRGHASPAVFPEFEREVQAVPHMHYGGPYSGPAELARIYGEVQVAWCIDFFEAGGNSDWLLPNRLYESLWHRTVPLALRGVETGRRLDALGAGLVFDDAEELSRTLPERLSAPAYRAEIDRIARLPSAALACDRQDCRDLVAALAGPSLQSAQPVNRPASRATAGP